MAVGYTYILGSNSGTLYIGVTSNLFKRILQHRDGTYEGFSKKYGCHRLLYYEQFEEITSAIGREKQLKGWTRAKKLHLIQTKNPTCKDLAEHWGATILFAGESIEDYEAHSLSRCSELESRERAHRSSQAGTHRDPSTAVGANDAPTSAQDDVAPSENGLTSTQPRP